MKQTTKLKAKCLRRGRGPLPVKFQATTNELDQRKTLAEVLQRYSWKRYKIS